MANKFPTIRELLIYLNGLAQKNDPRLDDTITVREQNGEYYPAEFLEFDGDEVMSQGHIVFQTYDWNEVPEE